MDEFKGVGVAATGAGAKDAFMALRAVTTATAISLGICPHTGLMALTGPVVRALGECVNAASGAGPKTEAAKPFTPTTIAKDGQRVLDDMQMYMKEVCFRVPTGLFEGVGAERHEVTKPLEEFSVGIDKGTTKKIGGTVVVNLVLVSARFETPFLLESLPLTLPHSGEWPALVKMVLSNFELYGLDKSACVGIADDSDVCLEAVARALNLPRLPCLSHYTHALSEIALSWFDGAAVLMTGTSALFKAGGGHGCRRRLKDWFHGGKLSPPGMQSALQGKGLTWTALHILETRWGSTFQFAKAMYGMPLHETTGQPLSDKASDVVTVTYCKSGCWLVKLHCYYLVGFSNTYSRPLSSQINFSANVPQSRVEADGEVFQRPRESGEGEAQVCCSGGCCRTTPRSRGRRCRG